ncbi:MAG: 5-histidylcysteine sulfoxide synthase, partial [Pseudobdellovibrionaceae bacterium]
MIEFFFFLVLTHSEFVHTLKGTQFVSLESYFVYGALVMALTVSRNPNLSAPDIRSRIQEVSRDPKTLEYQHRREREWWTGVSPSECIGFNKETRTLHALPLLNLEIATRQDILDYFNNSWTLTELLFLGLKNEEAFIRPPYHQLRHPLIFYYGHPAVLYINKLRIAGYFSEPVDLYLEKVLETGVDEMSWDDIGKNEMHWPSVFTVREYRQKIYNLIKKLIETHSDFELGKNRGPKSPTWSLWMGFEHEKIHFETSSVLIRELPVYLVEKPPFWPSLHPTFESQAPAPENTWVTILGGQVEYGKNAAIPSYGWDNEYGTRKATVRDFAVTKYLISNKEYYEFVKSGAYVDDKYWAAEGLSWRKFRNTKRPTFWVAHGPEGIHDYHLRTIWEIIEMPWAWPAEVNFHEALAYGKWKKEKDKSQVPYRLVTEAEHVKLRDFKRDPILQSTAYKKISAAEMIEADSFNFNFKWGSPCAVHTGAKTSSGVHDLFGNVWQWAEDQFNPLTGFEVHPYYDDFSTPCFDGKHQMILGGSFISCGHEASQWARFHFRPHFFQHAGFRMAKTLDGSGDNAAVKLLKSDSYIHTKRFDSLEQMSQLNWWKKVNQPLEMSENEMKKAFSATENAILNFYRNYANLHPGGTSHDPRLNSVSESFSLPYQSSRDLPERSEDLQKLLKMVFEELAPLGQMPGHPGYAAYVAGAGNLISSLAQLSAMTLNPFTGHYMMAPGLVAIEAEAIRWFVHLFGFPLDTAQGFFTTGGSMATVGALHAARQSRFTNQDWLKTTIYVSDQAHHCMAKAMLLLGFSLNQLKVIETSRPDFKINLGSLKNQI